MTHITIHTHISCSVTVDTPTHCLIYFAANAMHLSHLTVTGRTVDTSLNVRLVCVISIRFRLHPVDAFPGRLLLPLRKRSKFLNFRTFGLCRFVTAHARAYVRDRGVRRLINVFVAKSTLQLGSFVALLSNVLPVVKFDRLARAFWFT